MQDVVNQLGFEFRKKQSLEVADSLLEIMKTSLESGEVVLISGFGKFRVQKKAKRRGRNPATGPSGNIAMF